MIDREWLEQIKGKGPDGIEIIELLGVGTEKVVFKAKMPDGQLVALKTLRHHLRYHIMEIPLFLSETPRYRTEDLNGKLHALIGHPRLDAWSPWYDNLYSYIIKIISEAGVGGVIFSLMTEESVEYLPFILHIPAMKRKLGEIVDWPDPEPSDPNTWTANPNGPNYPVRQHIMRMKTWGAEALKAIDNLPQYNTDLQPEKLHFNPLFVWGAAIMDGFFTDDELHHASDYIKTYFGWLGQRDDAAMLLGQLDAIASLMAQYFDKAPIERLVRIGAMCGLATQVRNRSGQVVADGLKILAAR